MRIQDNDRITRVVGEDGQALGFMVADGRTFKTKKEAVNTALQELLNKKKRLGILELFGKIEYDPDYNYKEHRSRKKSVRKRRRS